MVYEVLYRIEYYPHPQLLQLLDSHVNQSMGIG